jgi:hypothetical protein
MVEITLVKFHNDVSYNPNYNLKLLEQVYRVFQERSTTLREKVLQVNVYRHNQTYP